MAVLLVALGIVPGLVKAQRADSAASVPAPVRVNVEAQYRYVFSHAEAPAGTTLLDASEGGFQVRRVRLPVTGSVVSPQLSFRIRPSYDRATGVVALDDAWVRWTFRGGWSVQAGQYKPQFLRDEFVGGFYQLAVERSYVADYFTIDYTQGVELARTFGKVRTALNVHDGSYGANTEFTADRTDLSLSARVEWLPFGEFRQFEDYVGWSNAPRGLLIGAAVDWEQGESDTTRAIPRVLKYTVDATLKLRGVSLAAALYAQRFAVDTLIALPTNLRAAHQAGALLQGSVFVVPDRFEVFARGEVVDFDGAYYRNSADVVQSGSRNLTTSTFSNVTLGVNWYRLRQNAKLSFDVQYAGHPVPVANLGDGLMRSDGEHQLVLRSQAQFRF